MQQPPNDPTQPSYPPPYTQYPPMQQPPKPKKRRRWPWIVGGIIVLIIIVSVLSNQGNSTTSTPPAATQAPVGNTPAVTQPPATAVPTKPPTWTTVQTFKGSGSKKTQKFTVGDNWRIKWTCDPASFGGSQFNVIIEVDNADGSYADLPVNTMCKPGNTSDTSYESSGGTYLLNVTSEGDWVIEVQAQK